MRGIRIPQAVHEDLLLGLETRGSGSVAVCSAGEYRRADSGVLELLHVSTTYARGDGRAEVDSVVKQGLRPLLIFSRRSIDKRVAEGVNVLTRSGAQTAALLAFVGSRRSIRVHGGLTNGSKLERVDYLSLPGPRTLRLAVQPLTSGKSGKGKGRARAPRKGNADTKVQTAVKRGESGPEGRRSRLAGALGEGDLNRGYGYLEQAEAMTAGVLGIGRLGSLIAFRLAQSGVGSAGGLVLADGDVVEKANRDVMSLPPEAEGMPKAVAVARMINALLPDAATVLPIVGTVSDSRVAEALIASDVIFSAVDEEYARLAVGVLARRYHRIHIDVTGGVARVGEGRVATGGEIRISVPGSPGCVSCFGTHRWDEIEDLLDMSAEQERERRGRTVWSGQRAGSWGDVLLPIVGESQQLFWRLIKGELRRSTWLHYEHATGGLPVWQDWTPRRSRTRRCRICGRQEGLGDGDL